METTGFRPKSVTENDINQWIADLNHDAFTVRQAAASRLVAAGSPARDALAEIVDSPDPEVRASARRLLSLIEHTEFNRQLEAFSTDIDGKRGLSMPGWEQFCELVGNDPSARALFVDMQRAEGPLLASVFGASPQGTAQAWEDRLTKLVSWQVMNGNRSVSPPLGSCAAVLFLGSVSELEVSDRGAVLLDNLIQRPPISEKLVGGAPQDAVRRLVIGWIVNCSNANLAVLERRLQLMSTLNLKEALPLAMSVAVGDKPYANIAPHIRATAILVIGQFGSREHAFKLEPLLRDTTVCLPIQVQQPGKPAANVQVRDVALVVMLHLTGQKPADYGYAQARLQPQHTFPIQTLHAANDQVRNDAVAKWHTWRNAHRTEGNDDSQGNPAPAEKPRTR